MKYLQENISFEFKNSDNDLDKFYADIILNNIEVEFCINRKYFENETINWEFVEDFTKNFIANFDFINKKTRKVSESIYNEYGNKLEDSNRFIDDNCYFTNSIFVELSEPHYMSPYPNIYACTVVENIFFNQFPYLNTSCIFTNFNEMHFVGIKASSIED